MRLRHLLNNILSKIDQLPDSQESLDLAIEIQAYLDELTNAENKASEKMIYFLVFSYNYIVMSLPEVLAGRANDMTIIAVSGMITKSEMKAWLAFKMEEEKMIAEEYEELNQVIKTVYPGESLPGGNSSKIFGLS